MVSPSIRMNGGHRDIHWKCASSRQALHCCLRFHLLQTDRVSITAGLSMQFDDPDEDDYDDDTQRHRRDA